MSKVKRIRSPWRRLVLSLSLAVLGWVDKQRPRRARVHWIGRYKRPRRLERALMVLLFAVAMFLLEPREYVLWSLTSGGAASLFLVLVTAYRLIPRRRAHWIR